VPLAGHDSSRGEEWRDFILQRLLGDRRTFRGIIAAFSTDERLGLVFPEDPNIVGWTENREPARSLLDRLGLSPNLPAAIEFPLGTMFWARPEALAPLLRAGFTADDFPAEPLPYDGSMLHAMERILPIVCTASGYNWRTSDRLDDINA
jgi:lipopolysaccharide biosynthesis protein